MLNCQANSFGKNGDRDCPILDFPVCGADGRSYQNDCHMTKAGVKKAYDGWCNAVSPIISAAAALSATESRPDLTVFVADEKNGFVPQGRPYAGCACDYTFNPVCGENGVTYANYCRAACKNVKPVHYGQCGAIAYDYDSRNTCQCDFNTSPTCGTNGITYENSCVSRCFGASTSYNGYCNLPCNCRFFFKPVCGENGKNFVNQCLLDCAQVNKFSDGLCANDTKCGKCFGPIKRTCGKDGKTYDNDCYMDCAGVKKQHDGHCVERWANSMYDPFSGTHNGYSLGNNNDLPNDLNRCFCPKNYLPVCGRNNVTYANECELNCVGVTKAKNGACNEKDGKEDSCVKNSKNSNYEPVCGSNRVTYYNKSMIGCESGVSVLYEGECKPIYYEWCKGRTDIAPVCGVDGRTYLNEDVLKCVGVEKYCDNTCELGANGWKIGSEQKGNVDKSVRADKHDHRYNDLINEYWYNAIWGNHKGEWTCSAKKDVNVALSCKPAVNIKYLLIENIKEKGAVVFMPPCRNLDDFELPYKKSKFPGFQGFIPDAKYIAYVLETAYVKGKFSIDSILEKVFKSTDVGIDALNFFMPLEQGNTEFEVKQKVADKRRKVIPADHKRTMEKDATLYYLYFNLLLKEKVVDIDTKIADDYCVRDALFYIVQDIWKLDLDKVMKSGNDFSIDFDKLMRF